MDYISLHTRYWTMNQTEAFQPADSHLYGCLVHLFNGKGQGKVWPESIQYTDGSLALLIGMDVKTMDRARTRLESRGLIETIKLGQGSRKGATYKLTTSPKKGEVKGEVVGDVMPEVAGEVAGEVSSTSPKKGEVNNQLLPQHTPQLPPQPLPKKEKSYIYIESKHQTPDKKTLKKLFFVAHRDDAAVWTAWVWLIKNKKKKKKKPPLPAPPQFPDSWTPGMIDLYQNVWMPYYRKKTGRSMQTDSLRVQIEKLSALNETELRNCIESSIGNGYQGLFPDKFKTNGSKTNAKNGAVGSTPPATGKEFGAWGGSKFRSPTSRTPEPGGVVE